MATSHASASRELLLGLVTTLLVPGSVHASPGATLPTFLAPLFLVQPASDADEQTLQKYLLVLEKRPRLGTAFDRVYAAYLQQGKLDELVSRYESKGNESDGTYLLLLGLIEARRGHDAVAIDRLTKAGELRPKDPIVPYYLSQAYQASGNFKEAAAALERCLEIGPAPTELFDVYQSLARSYQRSLENEKAANVWKRLEEKMPNDVRVLEQIANRLAEDGNWQQALDRYVKLIPLTEDEYRRSNVQLAAARMKSELGRRDEAIADLEAMTAKLNPESWLYAETRRRIEETFARSGDLAGLSAYYEKWNGAHPDDLDGLVRLARVLNDQGRSPEARKWLDKALKVAPKNRSIRETLIQLLVSDKEFKAAQIEYAALSDQNPNDLELLHAWGETILKDRSLEVADRQKKAGDVWRRAIAQRTGDAVVVAQIADWFRQAKLAEDALALYDQAISIDPKSPQYREYKGHYLHELGRAAEAVDVWKKIADGESRSAENLSRLAQILANFGYVDEAISALNESVTLDPRSFESQLRLAELLHRKSRFDDALARVSEAESKAETEADRDGVLDLRLRILSDSEKLGAAIETLHAKLKKEGGNENDWCILSRYCEAAGRQEEADIAIREAVTRNPRSISVLSQAARLFEQHGQLLEAVGHFKTLAEVDSRFRSEHLMSVVQIETRLGRTDQAIDAGKKLLEAAPGNPDAYRMFSDLLFKLGRNDEGIDILRRAIRLNPTDRELLSQLAHAHERLFQTADAIELNWQVFERSETLEDKLATIAELTNLYNQKDDFAGLIQRIERPGNRALDERTIQFCVAQAHQSSGNPGAARRVVEQLHAQDPRDTQILQQLATLAEEEQDLKGAAQYLRELRKYAPSPELDLRLANVLVMIKENDEARTLWLEVISKDESIPRVLDAMDRLLYQQQYELVSRLAEERLKENPKDWEILFRDAVALAQSKRNGEAIARFDEILSLNVPDESLSTMSKSKGTGTSRNRSNNSGQSSPSQLIAQDTYMLRSELHQEPNGYDYSANAKKAWHPSTFGSARMGCVAWKWHLTSSADAREEFVRQAESKAEKDVRRLQDLYYLQMFLNDRKEALRVSSELVKINANRQTRFQFLSSSMMNRESNDVSPVEAETTQLQLKEAEALLADPSLSSEEWARVIGFLKQLKQTEKAVASVETKLKNSPSIEEDFVALRMASMVLPPPRFVEEFDRFLAHRSNQPEFKRFESMVSELVQNVFVREGDLSPPEFARELYIHFEQWRGKKTIQAARRPVRGGSPKSINFYIIQNRRYVDRSFNDPQPSDRFSASDLTALRAVWCVHELNRDTDPAELSRAIQGTMEKASPAERVRVHLILSYLASWNRDSDESIAQLKKAAELAPDDNQLRMDLADAVWKQGDEDRAMQLLQGIEPKGQIEIVRMEKMRFELSIALGDEATAKASAEKLFGMPLSLDEQILLAQLMRRLGMNDQAENVLRRAQTQTGNRLEDLQKIAAEFSNQGKKDLASEVARRILQQSDPSNERQSNSRYAALSILKESGQLDAMIARLNEQIKESPSSIHLYEQLQSFYEAAEKPEEATKVLETLSKVETLDPRQSLQLAISFARQRKGDAAINLLKTALTNEPSLYGNRYWEINQAFQQCNKLDSAANVIIDALSNNNSSALQSWQGGQLIESLAQSPGTREAAFSVFERLWKKDPSLTNHVYSAEFWSHPKLSKYYEEFLVPPAKSPSVDPWWGMENISSYDGNGHIYCTLQRILDRADKARLQTLSDSIVKATTERPQWVGGKAVHAIILAKQEKRSEAKELLDGLLTDKSITIPSTAAWIIGSLLLEAKNFDDTAISFIQRADDNLESNLEYPYSPRKLAFDLYISSDNKRGARDVLLEAYKSTFDNSSDEYRNSQRGRARFQIAGDLLKTDYPFEILLLSQHYSDDIDMAAAARYGASVESMNKFIESAVSKVKNPKLTTDDLKHGLELLLNPPREWKLDQVAELGIVRWKPSRPSEQLPILCLFAETVSRLSSERDYLKGIREKIASRAKENPENLNGLVALAILDRWLLDDPAAQMASLSGVVQYINSHPFEVLEKGRKPTTRDERLAKNSLGPWFLLSVYSENKSDSSELDAIRRFSHDAATRIISEPEWLIMLVLNDPKMIGGPEEFASQFQMLVDSVLEQVKKPNAPKNETKQPCTTAQFENIQHLAELAIQRGRPDLSVEAIRQSLAGGLPVTVGAAGNASQGRRVLTSMMPVAANTSNNNIPVNQMIVIEALTRFSKKWKGSSAPADAVYSLMLSQLVPESIGRKPPINYLGKLTISLGSTLVDWTITSHHTDDLVKSLASVDDKSWGMPANLRSLLLRSMLASKQNDDAAFKKMIDEWAAYLEKDKSSETAAIVVSLLSEMLKNSDDAARVAPLIPIVSVRLSDQQANLIVAIYRKLIPIYLREDKLDKLQALLDEWHTGLQSKSPAYSRISEGLAFYLIQGNLYIDRLSQSVEYLTYQADKPRAGGIYRCDPEILMLLGRRVMALPAKERYEFLRDWTIPVDPQKSIRVVISAPMADMPSKDFLTSLTTPANADAVTKTWASGNSSLDWLIEAARESNMFDDLSAKVQEAKSKKTKNAEYLRYVVEVSRGNPKEVSAGLRSTLLFTIPTKAASAGDEQAGQVAWAFLLINSCFREPSLEAVGVQTINLLRGIAARAYSGRIPQSDMTWIVTKLLDLAANSNWKAVGLPALGENRRDFVKHWIASDLDDRNRAFVLPTSWWVSDGQSIKHVDGRGESILFYKYPLTGTFEVTGQCTIGFLQSANIGYAGRVLRTNAEWIHTSDLAHRYLSYNSQPRRSNDKFVSLRIKSSEKKVEWFLNDKLVFTDTAPLANSPWLCLAADGVEEPTWSNLKIEGTPLIPREVDLLAGEGLSSWYSPNGVESIRLPNPPEGSEDGSTESSNDYDWEIVNGELIGRKSNETDRALQDSLLVYGRPLGNGETVEYEFYHDPQNAGAHPAFGRYAFLIGSDGVKTRWMVSDVLDWTGVSGKNSILESQYQLGKMPLPLKPSDWNSVQFKFKDGFIEIALNGQPVFKRPAAPSDSRQFGLHHLAKQEQLRIRNIRLRGDWPESFTDEIRSNLASPNDDGMSEKMAQFLKRADSNASPATNKQ